MQRVGYTIQIFPSLRVHSDLNCAVWLPWILKCFNSYIFFSALYCLDSVWIGKSKSFFKLARAAMRHSGWNSGYSMRMSWVCRDALLNKREWRGYSCWEFMKTLKMTWSGLRKGPCANWGHHSPASRVDTGIRIHLPELPLLTSSLISCLGHHLGQRSRLYWSWWWLYQEAKRRNSKRGIYCHWHNSVGIRHNAVYSHQNMTHLLIIFTAARILDKYEL